MYPVLRITDIVKNNFETSRYWEYEKTLGNGSYGVAVLLRERESVGANSGMPNHRRRMAVKLALPLGVRELAAELKWLKVSFLLINQRE
jgi:hypothetical protein